MNKQIMRLRYEQPTVEHIQLTSAYSILVRCFRTLKPSWKSGKRVKTLTWSKTDTIIHKEALL